MSKKKYYLCIDPLESRDLLSITIAPIPIQLLEEDAILAIQVVTVDPGSSVFYSLVSPPSGATIDSKTGLFLFKPPPVSTTYQVTIQATDINDQTQVAKTPLNIYVFDNPPLINAGINATVLVGEKFSRTGIFTDPQVSDTWNGVVEWGDQSPEEKLVINSNKTFQLNHSYESTGSYTVVVSIWDSQGFQGRAFFGVTVLAPDSQAAPVASTPAQTQARQLPVVETVTDLYPSHIVRRHTRLLHKYFKKYYGHR